MKLNKSILLGVAALLALSSCNDWLDVNDNPNSPTDAAAPYDKRLAHIEFYTNSAYWFAGQPVSIFCGDITNNSRTNNYGRYAQWHMDTEGTSYSGRTTTCYQWFYVGAASNIKPMIDDALKHNAYHYAGVGHLILAYGMGLMHDLHGELPCYDALGENVTPTYPTGKEMFRFVIENIDKGLEYLQTPQGDGATALAANDYWGKGDVNKWIKFGYFLKARYLNRLVKKDAGKFNLENGDFKYDADLILDCLNKSFASVSDNMTIDYQDNNSTTHDVLGWNEPVDYNPLYSVLGMNSNYFFTKTVYDRLTNFDGKGIEDPRADRILPWANSEKTATTPAEYYGQAVKWDGNWRRTVGLDMQSTIRTEGAPYATEWNATDKQYFCNSETRQGDTLFVHQRCGGKGYYGGPDAFIYLGTKGEARSAESGTFYTRPDAPGWVGTYAEVCFIKAEVLFRKGDKNGAYTAYKAGVKAHMDAMNLKLNAWYNGGSDLMKSCASYNPMDNAAMEAYLNSAAIGTAADITLGKIMTQKAIALMFSPEMWVDMRRYDYDPQIFLHWGVPGEYYVNAGSQMDVPNLAKNKGPRRWKVSSHEYNYNTANLNAAGEYLVRDGAKWTGPESTWWNERDMWVIPVWWDTNHAD